MTTDARPPLNGTKTHPLSAHALDALRSLKRAPAPRQSFNSGITNRLDREHLIEDVSLPSPYASHKGALITFVRITAAGLAAIPE